tara:strand:+ start:176 stop:436 length:261 start_codon:yes stop_codon:yes gene_type:complete
VSNIAQIGDRSDDPFSYIESHTWAEHQGTKGKSSEVNVYSNCAEVGLLLNRQSLGTKTRSIKDLPAVGLNWNVNFKEGNNKLVAVI